MVSVPRTRLLRASPIGRGRPSRSIWTSKSAIARGFRRPLEVNVLGQLCAGQRVTDRVVTDVGDLAQTSQPAERLKDASIDADAHIGITCLDLLEGDRKSTRLNSSH